MKLTLLNRTLKLITMAGHNLKSKRARLHPKSDSYYFESYADINVHEEMLGDEIRTNTYKKAIFSLGNLIQNKVVLDVGAGTGILSCFCAQAGAKKVYAVEASSIAEQAKKVISSNGLLHQVEVIQGMIEDVELPEKVDVIVSEWMGYCLLYESMFPSVIIARDRWLKPDGVILPCSASLYIVPVCDDEVVVEKVNFWNDMDEVYGVDMTCILPFARKSLAKEVMVKTISCENVLSKPQLIAEINLAKATQEEIENVRHNFTFNSFGIADFQGFAIWFDVVFPCYAATEKAVNDHSTIPSMELQNFEDQKAPLIEVNVTKDVESVKEKDEEPVEICNPEIKVSANEIQKTSNSMKLQPITLSTSPYNDETHWKQAIFYFDAEVTVKQDTKISGSISLFPSSQNRRFLSVEVSCKIDDGELIQKTYFMGYELPDKSKSS